MSAPYLYNIGRAKVVCIKNTGADDTDYPISTVDNLLKGRTLLDIDKDPRCKLIFTHDGTFLGIIMNPYFDVTLEMPKAGILADLNTGNDKDGDTFELVFIPRWQIDYYLTSDSPINVQIPNVEQNRLSMNLLNTGTLPLAYQKILDCKMDSKGRLALLENDSSVKVYFTLNADATKLEPSFMLIASSGYVHRALFQHYEPEFISFEWGGVFTDDAEVSTFSDLYFIPLKKSAAQNTTQANTSSRYKYIENILIAHAAKSQELQQKLLAVFNY